MRTVIGLVLLGWLINTPWLLFLVVGVILTTLTFLVWTFARPLLGTRSPPRPWTRVEPRFESATNQRADKPSGTRDNFNGRAGCRDRSTDEKVSEGMAEKAHAARIAELLEKTKKQEEQIVQLRTHIRNLEAEAGAFPTRISEAMNLGREEVLHAFGHRRDQFESKLREYLQKQQARARHERSRREEQGRQEKQRQEDAARQRREEAQRRSRSSKLWWEVLGVRADASEDEVRQSYRIMARYYHPDCHGTGDTARMAEINAARDEAMRRFKRAA